MRVYKLVAPLFALRLAKVLSIDGVAPSALARLVHRQLKLVSPRWLARPQALPTGKHHDPWIQETNLISLKRNQG